MEKQEIIEKLSALPYPREDFWVITGAAMVLYGIRGKTHDIDLGCTKELADRLEAEGLPHSVTPDGSRWFRLGEDIEVFENWLCGGTERLYGVQVISIPGLIEMKRRLGREKDLRDIALIGEFLARNGAVPEDANDNGNASADNTKEGEKC